MPKDSEYNLVIKESLKLKGSSSKKKKNKKKVKEVESTTQIVREPRKKTEAEIKFEKNQQRRIKERAENLANKSHKDKVQEFNEKLDKLSEHYDIPKILILRRLFDFYLLSLGRPRIMILILSLSNQAELHKYVLIILQ